MPVQLELLQVLEHLPDFVHVGLAIDRGVGEHLESARLGRLDAFDGEFEDALALHRQIVILFHAVQMDVEDQAGMRLELLELLGQKHSVGAELDVLAARKDGRAPAAPISGYSSGSPPQIETMGASHSSTALRHCSSERRSRMLDSYSRMRPQPVQVRLQACSGSSIITSGKRLLIMGCGLRSPLGRGNLRVDDAEGIALIVLLTARFFCHSGRGRSLFLAM